MKHTEEQYGLLKAIIDKEIAEIDEEMATENNTDVASVISFHIEHGIRDVEKRLSDGAPTELEMPYGTSDSLKDSINQTLLNVEALIQYYYKACYFGTEEEQRDYRDKIFKLINS